MKNVFYIVTVIFLTVIGLTVNAKPRVVKVSTITTTK